MVRTVVCRKQLHYTRWGSFGNRGRLLQGSSMAAAEGGWIGDDEVGLGFALLIYVRITYASGYVSNAVRKCVVAGIVSVEREKWAVVVELAIYSPLPARFRQGAWEYNGVISQYVTRHPIGPALLWKRARPFQNLSFPVSFFSFRHFPAPRNPLAQHSAVRFGQRRAAKYCCTF